MQFIPECLRILNDSHAYSGFLFVAFSDTKIDLKGWGCSS